MIVVFIFFLEALVSKGSVTEKLIVHYSFENIVPTEQCAQGAQKVCLDFLTTA